MPTVLINPQGTAEALPPEHLDNAIQSGYQVPLNDPEGNPVYAPYADVHNLIQKGYQQPTPGQLQHLIESAHFSKPSQQALSFVEGATKGIAGPLAPLIESSVFPTDIQSIAKREEHNPTTNMLGELAGTGIGLAALPEGSLPGIISKVGRVAEAGVGLTGTFGRGVQLAAKGALESAAFEAAHQAHESILGNPDATAQSFVANVARAGLLGGGLGAALAPVMKGAEKLTGLAKGRTLDFLNNPLTPSEEQVNWVNLIKEGAFRTGAGAAIGHTFGGGPMATALAGLAGLSTGELASQAEKLALKLVKKGLGNEQAVKAITTLFDASMKTMNAVEKNSGAIFGTATARVMDEMDEKRNQKMIDKIEEFTSNPTALMEHLSNSLAPLSEAAPETSMAISSTMTNAINFLKTKIPSTAKMGVLNPERVPSQAEKAQFSKYVQTIEDPMSVFRDVKTGMISPNHLEALNTVYPTLYNQMKTAVLGKMTDYVAKHPTEQIPYKTRLGLSMFLGQNLDSTMSPQALMSNQAALQSSAADKAQQEQQGLKPSKAGMGKMKSAQRDRTTYEQSANRRSA